MNSNFTLFPVCTALIKKTLTNGEVLKKNIGVNMQRLVFYSLLIISDCIQLIV